jgi:hypothetical protein
VPARLFFERFSFLNDFPGLFWRMAIDRGAAHVRRNVVTRKT